jgi:hypothetical protein
MARKWCGSWAWWHCMPRDWPEMHSCNEATSLSQKLSHSAMYFPQFASVPGWPDWANFRLIGDLFTLGSFSKNYRSSTNNWAIFPTVKSM